MTIKVPRAKSAPSPGSFPITKRAAFLAQMETAIALWFNDGDNASLFALSFAVHEIARQAAKSKDPKLRSIKDPDLGSEEENKQHRYALEDAAGFFKHGGKNLDEIHHFRPTDSLWFLIDAIRLYARSGNSLTPLMQLLWAWARLRHSYVFIRPEDIPSGGIQVEGINVDEIRNIPKELVYSHFLDARQLLRKNVQLPIVRLVTVLPGHTSVDPTSAK